MCGLTGLLLTDAALGEADLRLATERMRDTLAHRGPDDAGTWLDASTGIALGHRRLSILDLSPEGHQPMVSASGRFVLAYNGEVYNYRELRGELAGRGATFRGGSDTEVMLAAFEAWGLAEAVRRFRGIFAFACWDRSERALTLGRDHLGVKPLYYARAGQALAFASELRAIERAPGFDPALDHDAIALLLRRNCIPAPFTAYRAARKLPPATLATWRRGQGDPEIVTYWSAAAVAEAGAGTPLRVDDAEAVERLETLLLRVIGRQMLSDVPLGAFLSGGVDSSTVVALMQRLADRPVRTFSIGSDNARYDEAGHAAAVARHLGTDHTELVVTGREALEVVPRLATLYDEPFADSSQIPTFLVSVLARKRVTVALSGDGGDELFGGYNRHVAADALWRRLRPIPRAVRASVGWLGERLSPSAWDALGEAARRLGARGLPARPGPALRKAAALVGVPDPGAMYERLVSHWSDAARVVPGSRPVTAGTWPAPAPFGTIAERMMLADLLGYLPDDILVKVDRASMAVGLEARVPLLDPDVVTFAWQLPLALKLRQGRGKWILRQVLHRHVPWELVDRPKAGFAVPLGAWLRGPLRDWAEALLAPDRLAAEGVFAAGPVRRCWAEHLSGRRDREYELWDVLMFQAWREARPR